MRGAIMDGVLRYRDPAGYEWRFGGWDYTNAFVIREGISGMVGSVDMTTVKVPGSSGVVDSHSEIPPMSGTLRIHVAPNDPNNDTDRAAIYYRLRGAVQPSKPGRLFVSFRGIEHWCDITRSGAIDWADERPEDAYQLRFDIPVRNKKGVWFRSHSSVDRTVTVTNNGDTITYPTIEWLGAGGTVILPSGATFELPMTIVPLFLSLDPADSLAVTNADGELAETEWHQVRGQAYGEGVPAGKTGAYTTPPGAILRWDVGVVDPMEDRG